MGMDPGPLTLREVAWLWEGRGYQDWARASALMAQQCNLYRKKGSRAVNPEELNPFAPGNLHRVKPKLNMAQSMAALKAAFFGPKTKIIRTKPEG